MKANHIKCDGKYNTNARKYLLISPDNTEYIIHGSILAFYEEHTLSVPLFRKFINKGKITYVPHKYTTINTQNSIGWEIKTID
jgi:hypothetical protein